MKASKRDDKILMHRKNQSGEVEKIPPSVPKGIMNSALIIEAVKALLLYHEKQQQSKPTSLLGSHAALFVTIGLDVAPLSHETTRKMKPYQILIPHPIYKVPEVSGNLHSSSFPDDRDEPDVCLIVKDNDTKKSVEDLLRLFFSKAGCGCVVKKVMTLSVARKEYERFVDRRTLVSSYDVFMCDDRILPMMPATLGREFFRHKKLPIPITVTRSTSFPFRIIQALSSTYVTVPNGTCVSIRVGYTHMSSHQLTQNIVTTVEKAVAKVIPRSWANVKSIEIKTTESTALPIYQKSPIDMLQLAQEVGVPPVWVKGTEKRSMKSGRASSNVSLVEGKEVLAVDSGAEGKSRPIEKKRERDNIDTALQRALKKKMRNSKNGGDISEPTGFDASNHDSNLGKSSRQKSDDGEKSGIPPVKKRDAKNPNHKDHGAPKQNAGAQVKSKKDKASVRTSNTDKPTSKLSPRSLVDTSEDSGSNSKKRKMLAEVMGDGKITAIKQEVNRPPDGTDDYCAASKYCGKKVGYVFKMAQQGLGYYRDRKPIVDEMALAAIRRLSAGTFHDAGKKKVQGKYGRVHKHAQGDRKMKGRR
jgi:ribosome biogenesis protein UTP30